MENSGVATDDRRHEDEIDKALDSVVYVERDRESRTNINAASLHFSYFFRNLVTLDVEFNLLFLILSF